MDIDSKLSPPPEPDMTLILGVTASGKSRLAFDLAQNTDAEIICIDSMKVYRRMDIGTAKPPKQARDKVKYHLIDVVEPSDAFSVAEFVDLACQAIDDIRSRGKKVIAVGGTALYIKALRYGLFDGPGTDENLRQKLKKQAKIDGLPKLHQQLQKIDPISAQRIHPNDAKRIVRALEVYELTGKPISSFQLQFDAQKPRHNWNIIGLTREKSQESMRINARVKKMIKLGLVDEVKSLLAEPKPLSPQASCAIGYAEMIDHLNSNTTIDEAAELIKKNSRRFAKSQRTWFKTFKDVNWLNIDNEESAEQVLDRAMKLLLDR